MPWVRSHGFLKSENLRNQQGKGFGKMSFEITVGLNSVYEAKPLDQTQNQIVKLDQDPSSKGMRQPIPF